MSQPGSVRREAAVLIVEDHAPMREAIRVCIERFYPGLSVIEAPDGATALRYVEAHCPSIVFMDINLPDANGLDLTREILKKWPRTFVAAISIDTSADLPEQVRAAGAVEFIAKDKLFERLLPLVGAAVTLRNWMEDLECQSAITDGSPHYGGHHAEHLLETGALRVGHE
ncbi:response regulator [Polaromonas eurypsychrophila]|uniref:Response regulatory domain-containing protein n=1 Tax=Polaromonas eurypsychrophila TaxID=1614635 RepID=A0A916SHJ3_9BURK|nr:response regulator [Polaromonas eurypsychrophila]GGA97828.1 hypothetical protein GCM10011496_18620 [Polaromonas eurypsychrophila]